MGGSDGNLITEINLVGQTPMLRAAAQGLGCLLGEQKRGTRAPLLRGGFGQGVIREVSRMKRGGETFQGRESVQLRNLGWTRCEQGTQQWPVWLQQRETRGEADHVGWEE